MSGMMPDQTVDPSAPAADLPAEPPADAESADMSPAMARHCRERADALDYLTAGLDDLFAAGAYAPSRAPGNLASNESRAKAALRADYEGEIPRLWTVAGDGMASFLDRLPGCPDDPLRVEIEEHKAEEQAVAEELQDRADAVRDLMVLLDERPMGVPMASKRARRGKTALEDVATEPTLFQGTVPGGSGPSFDAAQAEGEAREKREREQKAFQAKRNWYGMLWVTVSQIQKVLGSIDEHDDRKFDRAAIAEALGTIRGIVDPVKDTYLRPETSAAMRATARLTDDEIFDQLVNTSELLNKLVQRVPEGLNVDTNAILRADEMLRGSPRTAVLEKRAFVRKCDGKWCVFSHDGKKLGEHDTREDAINQLRAIEVHKHGVRREAAHDDPPMRPSEAVECPDCEGFGIERGVDLDTGATVERDCPTCGGHGVVRMPGVRDRIAARGDEREEPEDDVSLDADPDATVDVPEPDEPSERDALTPEETMPEERADEPVLMLDLDLPDPLAAPEPAIPMPPSPARDPLSEILEMMPSEDADRDLSSRIDELVSERKRLEEAVGDRAEEVVDMARRFRGEAANRTHPLVTDRRFSSFQAWKRAMRQIDPGARFEGDRDIAFAFAADGRGIGEWDGARGSIYQ